jgi:hypothetical protein
MIHGSRLFADNALWATMPPSWLPTGVAIWLPVSSPSPGGKDGTRSCANRPRPDLLPIWTPDFCGNGVGIWPTPRGDRNFSMEVAPLIFQLSSDNSAIASGEPILLDVIDNLDALSEDSPNFTELMARSRAPVIPAAHHDSHIRPEPPERLTQLSAYNRRRL